MKKPDSKTKKVKIPVAVDGPGIPGNPEYLKHKKLFRKGKDDKKGYNMLRRKGVLALLEIAETAIRQLQEAFRDGSTGHTFDKLPHFVPVHFEEAINTAVSKLETAVSNLEK